MAQSKLFFTSYLKEIDPRELFKMIKYLFSNAFKELEACKMEQLKDEHQKIFKQLRLDYAELIKMVLAFCDNTLPLIEIAVEHLRGSNDIDFSLLLNITQELDPNELMKNCEKLHTGIINLNDSIASDPYYKATGLKRYLRSFVGGVLFVGSVVLVCIMPWALPLEAAIVAGTLLVFGGTIPSSIQFFKGLTAVQLEKDVAELSKKLNEAKKHVGNITAKLSDIRLNHKRMSIRVEREEANKLVDFYELTQQNITELRTLCKDSLIQF